METLSFNSLGLSAEITQNLASLSYTQMTPIQAQSLPAIIEGKDVLGQGKTGSGKTVAFGLGLLHSLNTKHFNVQALVLCPTRELADQVTKELRKLARTTNNVKILTLCGGMPFGPQVGSLEHGAHIVVGTPGRIEEHLRKGKLNTDQLKTLVLDEADRMLDMGFQDVLDNILEHVPKKRQTLLFSATFPEQVSKLTNRVMRSPVIVKVKASEEQSTITQYFYKVSNGGQRNDALITLLYQYQPLSALVFCNTKRETQEVLESLRNEGISAVALHGDLDQRMRDQTLVRFSNKSATVLVATDVAARGLDIDSLELVVNLSFARENEVHVHRIGRTGRAGATGVACTLFTEKERYRLASLSAYLERELDESELPHSSEITPELAPPQMSTLQLDAGKKQKIRPGDILGALTRDGGLNGKDIGKIQIFEYSAYVAVAKPQLKHALHFLQEGKIKGRSFRARHIRG